MKKTSVSQTGILRMIILLIVFLSLTCLLYLGFRQDAQLTFTSQKLVFSLGLGALLAGIATALLTIQMGDVPFTQKKWWFYPLISALLGFCIMSLAYVYLGVWPFGDRSVMIVDMHHQYAPLLAKLKTMLINGGSPFYSFEIGLGTSFIPLFGYYLASPFNILLVLFPDSFLNESILIITLLKNMLTAGLFALCVQYVYRRRSISVIIVSVLYSTMMYLIAYSWNLMWLDCIMILPLIVMSLEKLIRTGKYLSYVLSLAYALYANYYIGFMLCLFLVLYFICMTIRQKNDHNKSLLGFGRFALGSILGGGLAMFLIVPVYISLGNTSAAGSSMPEMKANFEMFALLGRHLFETTPTIRSGNLPNIYCGLLSVLLLPIFATLKTISLRRRIAYIGLLSTLAISFVINQFDLLWHGLHAPNDLPYRFSFLYSFVLLLIAFETLINIRHIRPRQIAGSFTGILGFIILVEHLGGDDYDFDTIYISLLLVLVYAIILGLTSRRHILVRSAYALILLIVTVESVFNTGASFKTMQSNEYFTARADYVANDTTKAIRKAVERTKDIGDNAVNGSFYRMEFLPRRTTVDTALFDYRGMTIFASSSPQSLTKFMGYIGYAVNGVNSHLYKSFVPMMDSLIGIRYVILDSSLSDQLSDDPYLEYIDKVSVGDYTYSIYENKTVLPLGYMCESSIRQWTPSQYDPIISQNALLTDLTGIDTELYTLGSIQVESGNESVASVNGTVSFSMSPQDNENTGRFSATIDKTGQTYAFVDCRAAKSIQVTSGSDSWSVSPHEPYVINTGLLQQGDTITVSITAESSCSGNIYVGTLDEIAFENAINKLKSNPLNVNSFNDTNISGTINATKSGVLFTSIPYDDGWTVKVDGKKVETFSAGNAMLAFELDAGQHNIEMHFHTVGLLTGVIISLVSLVLLILLLKLIKNKVDRNDPHDNEFLAFSRLIVPQPKSLPSTDSPANIDMEPENINTNQPINEDECSAPQSDPEDKED